MRRTPTTLVVVALVTLVALLAPACSSGGGLELSAVFDDVENLVVDSMVRAHGVRIGTVTGIELTDDHRALVRMSVDDDTGLPAEVRAELRQTNLLGERYVELVPTGETGELRAGRIDDTEVVADLENLIATGNDLLAYVAADRLAAAVQAGAITFGGRGSTVGTLLTDLEATVGTFDARKTTIVELIDDVDGFLDTVAAEAETNAAAITALARSSAALQDEDDRLLDAAVELRRLTDVGGAILREHRQELDNLVRRVRKILDAVTAIDGSLQNLLDWLPRHDLHVPNGIYLEHAQLWNDYIVCGFNDDQGDPSEDCTPATPDEPPPPPPGFHADECDESHRNCGYPDGVEPGTTNEHPSEDPDGGGS